MIQNPFSGKSEFNKGIRLSRKSVKTARFLEVSIKGAF